LKFVFLDLLGIMLGITRYHARYQEFSVSRVDIKFTLLGNRENFFLPTFWAIFLVYRINYIVKKLRWAQNWSFFSEN